MDSGLVGLVLQFVIQNAVYFVFGLRKTTDADQRGRGEVVESGPDREQALPFPSIQS
jgi:hypothetical protein